MNLPFIDNDNWDEIERAMCATSVLWPVSWRILTITDEDGDILSRHIFLVA